jgi:hypothetical protein
MAYLQDVEVDWNTFKVIHTTLATSTLYYLQNDLQYVPFVIQESTSPMVGQAIYYCGVNRDPKAASGPYAALTSGTLASATIQGIVYTATSYGASSVTVQYAVDAPAVGQESVTVAGNAITVHIHAGTIAQQVLAAVSAWNAYNGNATFNSQAAAYLVSAVIQPGKEGQAQIVQSSTPLTGGTAAVTTLSDWTTNYMGSATLVASFSVGVGLEL